MGLCGRGRAPSAGPALPGKPQILGLCKTIIMFHISARDCVCHSPLIHSRSHVHLQLLPYLYSEFMETHRTGVPVARPLIFAAPADPQARAAEGQWLLGDSVLVSPVLKQGATEVLTPLQPSLGCDAPLPWQQHAMPLGTDFCVQRHDEHNICRAGACILPSRQLAFAV